MEWIKELGIFDRIAVTGPQRSGTTIAAKIIAEETGHDYIDEDDFGINSYQAFKHVFNSRKKIVVQCPGLCHKAHEIGEFDNTAVVMMIRNVDDIIASQERIGWAAEKIERFKYNRLVGPPIAEIKYQYWEDVQKHQIKHQFEIVYESLKGHRLWVPKEKRTRFKIRQTELSR